MCTTPTSNSGPRTSWKRHGCERLAIFMTGYQSKMSIHKVDFKSYLSWIVLSPTGQQWTPKQQALISSDHERHHTTTLCCCRVPLLQRSPRQSTASRSVFRARSLDWQPREPPALLSGHVHACPKC